MHMGGVENVLITRDTVQAASSNIDARSLGIGIVIGMLSTLILVSLGFLLSTTSRFTKNHHHHHHTTGASTSISKFTSSSRRHLVRSVVGTNERITIEDDDEPYPTFASSHNYPSYPHHRHIRSAGAIGTGGMYDMHPLQPSTSLEDLPVIDIAPIPRAHDPASPVKIDLSSPSTSYAHKHERPYWAPSSSGSNTPSPTTSTTLQTHTELLPSSSQSHSQSQSRSSRRPVSSPPHSSSSSSQVTAIATPPPQTPTQRTRRSSISKSRSREGVGGTTHREGTHLRGHMATPSLGQSPPPPYANHLTQTEDGAEDSPPP